MTMLKQCENYLRFGEQGDYVETFDGKMRVTRKDGFVNTLPTCYITENGVTRTSESFYGDVVKFLEKMIAYEGEYIK